MTLIRPIDPGDRHAGRVNAPRDHITRLFGDTLYVDVRIVRVAIVTEDQPSTRRYSRLLRLGEGDPVCLGHILEVCANEVVSSLRRPVKRVADFTTVTKLREAPTSDFD